MRIAIAVALTACSTAFAAPLTTDPRETGSSLTGCDGQTGTPSRAVPDVRCTGTPRAGAAGSFRHLSSRIVAALGDPQHRGFDLVAPASAETQLIEGWISYTLADKALEDEDVEVFACRGGAWATLGSARTDGEGHFALALTAARRLPIAMRDLYVSVVGDRTGTAFLADVVPDNTPLIASDVDGTLTSSENGFLSSLAFGATPKARAGAAAAYRAAARRGYQLVYVTARGNQYTARTRQWLAANGFPRGPVRLSPSFVTLPGADTVTYKTATLAALRERLTIALGIGNRASDIAAYGDAGIPEHDILVELPEFEAELAGPIAAGDARGFTSYAELAATTIAALPAY
ncbi:hypothetical protein BH11MYX1_BH11MYX1_04550 [soil metagenome]